MKSVLSQARVRKAKEESEPQTKPQSKGQLAATRVHFAGQSEAGEVRKVNQDTYFVGATPQGVLGIVADGMGGHQSGEIASQSAVKVLSRALKRAQAHPPAAIARAVQDANLEIYDYATEHPESRGMGTTLTTLLVDDQIGLVGHVGDSRAYLVRGGEIHQLTQDHSWVADRVRQGLLSEEEARHHRWRNIITNALGSTPEFKLDIFHFEVRSGDTLMLCSDGVTTLLSDEVILQILRGYAPEDAAAKLIESANERGSPDNVTAVVLFAEAVEPKPKRYDLPKEDASSVRIGETMSGIYKVEEAYPSRNRFDKLRRQNWYPYRVWILGCIYLFVLFLYFSLR